MRYFFLNYGPIGADTLTDTVNECAIEMLGKPDMPGTRFRFVHPGLGPILDVVFDGRETTKETGVHWLDFHTEVFSEDQQRAGDFNKLFSFDPNWMKMSKEDRQILMDYAKLSPEEVADKKLQVSRLTQDMREEIALKLVDSWPAEVAEAAKAAFTDPGFVISLILTIAVYIGLWLTPDPTMITKVAAGTLTAVMWAMFAWEDVWKTMTEYSVFEESVRRAPTLAELRAAGNRMHDRREPDQDRNVGP